MLTADELRDARDALKRANGLIGAERHRVKALAMTLLSALDAYDYEARFRQPRLDCITTAVRALTGALRDRLEDDRG